MSLLQWKLDDHRGNQVTMYHGTTYFGFRRDVGRDTHRALERDIETRIGGKPIPPWERVALFCLPFLAIGGLILMWHFGMIRVSPWWLLFAPIAIIFGVIFASPYRRKFTSALVESFLAIGHCPTCSYDLHETLPEPDGCRVCPECGAAWRIEDAGVMTDRSEP